MESNRVQVRKIIDYQAEIAKREFDDRRCAIYAEHSAKGRLQSGTTIRRVVRLMEEVAARFVSENVEKVGAVARDPDGFAEISKAVSDFWEHLERELHSTCKTAGGRGSLHPSDESITRSALELLQKSRTLVDSKLELYRFTFASTAQPKARSVTESVTPPISPESNLRVRKGGRPLGEHWDEMWSAIAFALYVGDLNPKSQAEVERAMQTWLEAHGFDAATSTVRQRARRLWDRLTADK